MTAAGPAAGRASSARALLFFWLVCAGYLLPFIDRGWIPHDEGTHAQSAERVAQGELPHRDFDEGYTGGLSYLHAFGFTLFGTNLLSLRIVLYLSVLVFIPVVYAIARRAASPLVAGVVTLTCVAWTVPNYFASMPSWYNLFFATFGAYALLRHVETGGRRWLFLAGLWAGLSILVKIVGLYDVAAVLLFLAYREQTLASAREPGGRRSVAFALFKSAVGIVFVLLLLFVFRARHEPMDVLHFLLPGAALVALVIRSEWREGTGRSSDRLRELARLVVPFAAGAALPLLAFAVPYLVSSSIGALFYGVFVRPQRQIETAFLPFPSAWTLLAAIPYATVLAFPRLGMPRRRAGAILAVAVLLGALLLAGTSRGGYAWIWNSARSLAVVAVLVGCVRLAARGTSLGLARRQELFLLLSLAAFVSLVQFPYSAPIYLCYAAPLVALAILFLVAGEPGRVGWIHFGALVFYLAFAILFMNPGYVYFLGGAPIRYRADGRLAFDRGKLRVPSTEAQTYTELVAAVAEKAKGGFLYAGPDSPEVYFLCGRRNLTRIFFERLSGVDTRISIDPVNGIRVDSSSDTVRRVFEREDVKAIVWNRSPQFTHGLWRVYRDRLNERFPHSREIGKFILMWRD